VEDSRGERTATESATRDRQRSHGGADRAPDCKTGGEVLDASGAAAAGNGANSRASAGRVVEGGQSHAKEPFPAEVKKIQDDLLAILHILHDKFPNLKMVYLSNRIYGRLRRRGAQSGAACLRTGFAVKWLIADQSPESRS